jgi:hypothetical protein
MHITTELNLSQIYLNVTLRFETIQLVEKLKHSTLNFTLATTVRVVPAKGRV